MQNWTYEEVKEVYEQPLLELVYKAATVHRMHWDPREVQQCTLLSIKTGGCTEDCKYCSQSAHHKTFVKPEPTKKVDEVIEMAKRAKAAGSTRFCMGSAWREVGKKNAFKHVLTMVREVKAMDMEVCCTLGLLTEEQAVQLKEAGLSAYNHNLDTSREHYPNVSLMLAIAALKRSYCSPVAALCCYRSSPRARTTTVSAPLRTCARPASRSAAVGFSVSASRSTTASRCCTRFAPWKSIQSLYLSTLSVRSCFYSSIRNSSMLTTVVLSLVSVEGTPLYDEESAPVTAFDMARAIAAARILMPKSMVRLSAGRMSFTEAEQGMLFMAGANSIFNGDTLLTTANPAFEKDRIMFERMGLRGKPAHTAHQRTPYIVKITHSAPVEEEETYKVASM